MPFADITKPPKPLPQPRLQKLGRGLSLLPPLSRRGSGPGLIVLYHDHDDQLTITEGIPSPPMKWAEEGYAVVEIQAQALDNDSTAVLKTAVDALRDCQECTPRDAIGIIAYNLKVWNRVAPFLASFPEILGTVLYADAGDEPVPVATPSLRHLAGASSSAGATLERSDGLTKYFYDGAKSALFSVPFQPDFDYRAESLSHTRSLTFLKPLMGGPYFDLETIWEEHAWYEFGDRSVEHTMSTMVQEPYVNHVPTLTGGIGRQKLTAFYRDHFIFNNPADAEMELISRTIGIDRVIEEFIYKFSHTLEVDWLIPGLPPTGKKVEVPMMAVVNVRGDRLYHEHISWDQGSVLRQLGLMPQYLPFPYAVPGVAQGKEHEYRVPVGGIETASKLRDNGSIQSNKMFEFQLRECNDLN